MEGRFAEDFSGVRVHSDAAAHRGTVGMFARALTVGDHIALGPEVPPGDDRTLAHELAHVVQQRASGGVGAPGSAPELERAADTVAGTGSPAGVAARVGRPVPAVQLDRLQFGAGQVLVVVENGSVTMNGVTVGARPDPDGRLRYNGREIVLDRSGVMRYRDRYTVCRPCNPEYYEGTRWTQRPGMAIPESQGSFYDPTRRSWVLRHDPVVTTAVLTPSTPATPGPIDPRLESRVHGAQLARQQFESRVDAAMANGRSRADAEALVRGRMEQGVDRSGLGTFETGQTYAVAVEEVGEGVTRRSTTGAVAGGETPTVSVPAPQLRARLAEINRTLGENFVVNDQTLNHAEVRSIVRTPQATSYYVNRDMCSSCQRYFLMEARAQGRPITVVDPSTTRVFSPDYRITEIRPDVVYERSGAVVRTDGVSRVEIGEHPSVTHSVRTVPRTTAVPEAEGVAGRSAAARAAAEAEPGRAHTLGSPTVRPGVVEPEGAGRGKGIPGRSRGGIRRFALSAGRLLAEGLLTIVMVIIELIIQLIIIPYLERLRRQLEEKYRQLLERQIQNYYEGHLAGQVENRVLRQAGMLRLYEDRDLQPYVNTTLRVHFKRAWSFWTGQGYGPPESIVDLDFVSMDIVEVDISDSPVTESSDALKADDEGFLTGDSWSTEFSQVMRFAAIPPAYQELVEQFGTNPESRARTECFIATACYGSAQAPALDTLRFFRDQCLTAHPLGRRFVDGYYRLSPPVARFLTQHASARWVVRLALVGPAVRAIRVLGLDRGSRHPEPADLPWGLLVSGGRTVPPDTPR